MKVLIIKLSSIGDVIHTLPALESLRKGFRKKGIKARIDWLVEEAASDVLKNHPSLDNLIVVKRGWGRNFKENLLAAKRLAMERYDLVLDFQGLLKSGVWVWLTKGVKRTGFSNARELSHIFYNEKLPAYDPEMHAVDRYLSLARHAGGDVGEAAFTIGLKGEKERVVKLLQEKGIGKREPFFVVVPRARWETKLWNDDKFAALIKKVHDETGLKGVLIGGNSDGAALERIREAAGKGAVSLAGKTGLRELFELLRLSRFVVTVDSGPMHLAAAAGAKCVAIFGPTAPWRTGPYGKGHAVIRKGLDCSPCFRKKCPQVKCMEGVTVEDVWEGVKGLLGNR